MYKLTATTIILREDGTYIPPDPANNDYANYLDWIAEGNIPIPADIPTIMQQQLAIEVAIQEALDAIAQKCNYDNIKSACAYASTMPWVPDTDPHFAMCEKFRRQGNYAQNRMSLTWAMCYSYLATVQAGTNPMPTPAEAVAMMPQFIWPD